MLARAKDKLRKGDVALFCHGHISRVLAMRWVGLPVANGGMILMNPAAITVLGTYHDAPCIEHANVVPFRPPQISQQPDEGFDAEVDEFSRSPSPQIPGWGMPDSRIRPITPEDVPAVVELVYDLAEYERLRELCHLTDDQLARRPVRAAPGAVRVGRGGREPEPVVVGYALYFLNFSTWEGVHGIYLEDLYVRPDQRGSGLGRALLTTLAGVAAERGYARVEWSVLDWNAPSIAFYRSLGRRADGRLDGLPAHWSGPAKGSGNRLIHALAGLLTSRYPVTPPSSDQRDPPAVLPARGHHPDADQDQHDLHHQARCPAPPPAAQHGARAEHEQRG